MLKAYSITIVTFHSTRNSDSLNSLLTLTDVVVADRLSAIFMSACLKKAGFLPMFYKIILDHNRSLFSMQCGDAYISNIQKSGNVGLHAIDHNSCFHYLK